MVRNIITWFETKTGLSCEIPAVDGNWYRFLCCLINMKVIEPARGSVGRSVGFGHVSPVYPSTVISMGSLSYLVSPLHKSHCPMKSGRASLRIRVTNLSQDVNRMYHQSPDLFCVLGM